MEVSLAKAGVSPRLSSQVFYAQWESEPKEEAE